MVIVYFEGLRCSGKTTLIEAYNRSGVVRIMRLLPKVDRRLQETDFMKQDEQKCALASREAVDRLVLVDRCYLSTLLYNTVRQEDTPSFSAWPVYEWLIDHLGTTLKRPDMYVFIDTPIEICRTRAESSRRTIRDDLWLKYPQRMQELYWRLFEVFEHGTPIHVMDGRQDISSLMRELDKLLIGEK
jgi:thymidylate kinase